MSTLTSFLNLIQPGNGEFVDTWDLPLRNNFANIDSWASVISDEIIAARFNKASLPEFLSVSHETDGTLKPSQEVIDARSSNSYGDQNLSTSAEYLLDDRIEQGDVDVFEAREGEPSLRSALAAREILVPNMIIDGAKNANGYPTWMSFNSEKVIVNGSSTVLQLMIDGWKCHVREQAEITLAGGSGTYFIFAQFSANGVMKINGDPNDPELELPKPPTALGVVSVESGENYPRLFTDTTIGIDYLSSDIQPGDQLIIPSGDNKGTYIIRTIVDATTLKIIGRFNKALATQSYTIRDQLAVTYGFDATLTPAAGKQYIGEAIFDGIAVTSVIPRHFKDFFVGAWLPVDTGASPLNEQNWTHGLGTDNLEITFQASQSNDGSTPTETLSEATLLNTLSYVGAIGTLAIQNDDPVHTNPTISSGDQTLSPDGDVTHNVQLNGLPGGSLGGAVIPNKSVRSKYNRNTVWVKGAVSGVFYTDFSDNIRTTGFIRVIVRKRG